MKTILCIIFILFSVQPAYTQIHMKELQKPVTCALHELLIKELNTVYNESKRWSSGISESETHFDFYQNDKLGTWTMLERKANIACILGTGNNGPSV